MRTREEGRAAREAALREARHSIPVSGIIVGAIAFAALGYFGWQIWDQNVRSPGYITRQYIAAWQKKDWPTMKLLSTAESVPWIDAWAKRVQESAGKGDLPMKIQEFEETEFRIDSVEPKGNTATLVCGGAAVGPL